MSANPASPPTPQVPDASVPRPSTRVIAAACIGLVATVATTIAIVRQSSTPSSGPVGEAESRFDLDHCEDKPTYARTKCKHGSIVACWSADPNHEWACWAPDETPAGPLAGLSANVQCLAREGGPFHGACTFLKPSSLPPPPAPLPPLMPWDQAYNKARLTLQQMTSDEKKSLLRGVGWIGTNLQKWWYVGNTGAVPRLGIPSLNMQDAAGGFRTYWNELVGTVTCWPSLLSIAATWDPDAVQNFGVALGEEFSGKGANAILGPSVDVHRVARGGRNFEFLSGEDPFLGGKMAKAYVEGVQSKGVFAVMKHWIFDSQETNRETENSVVDDKTAWELYYPPFQAAVEAGVSAAMCSYNRVDGKHACSNSKQMREVLKQRMGFRGFVQSDWWATHATTLQQGLDQEMPSTDRSVYFDAPSLALQPAPAIDEAATRILAVVHRMNLSSTRGCAPPNCRDMFLTQVATKEHHALAHTLATESIVLLKNKDAVLPFSPREVKTIAVIGSAASAKVYNPNGQNQGADGWSFGDYYAGGGSGHVVAGEVSRPLDAITHRASLAGMKVIASASDDHVSAIEAAKQADVAVVVAATTSGESKDRLNLNLDNDADSLISAVARQTQRTVVLVQAPGAVLMPWRDSVSSIAALFLGGEATGKAWADVLFGDHSPTGKLPMSIPHSEEDTIPPNPGATVTYTEGLATGYRNKGWVQAFPFGHGLTYTAFNYETPKPVRCPARFANSVICLLVPVKNVGWRAARTVAQLYLELPKVAGHPTPFLKGFQKTGVLLPGHTSQVIIPLQRRDMSYYDANAGAWVESSSARAHIGESSKDIRQVVPLSRSSGGNWNAGKAHERKHQPKHVKEPIPSVASHLRAKTASAPAVAAAAVAAAQPPAHCSSSSLKEDCRKTMCCTEAGLQCYRKNPWWATCRKTCTPGSANPLEEKKFQTPWDCRPLGERTPLEPAAPTSAPTRHHEKAPKRTVSRTVRTVSDSTEEEVVLRMKASEVPDGWARGTPVTVLGDDGEHLAGEVVHVDGAASGGGKAPRSSGGASPVVACIVSFFIFPLLALLVIFGWWAAKVRGTAEDQGFVPWVQSTLATGVEAAGAAARSTWTTVAGGIADMVAGGKPGPMAPGKPHGPQASPTHSPLMAEGGRK